MNLTATVEKRSFPDVINEWTNKMLELNRDSGTVAEAALIMRVGVLGQRLIYESHALGLNDGLKIRTEAREVIGG